MGCERVSPGESSVWLMSQSAEHRQHAIGNLEWMVMPAILLRQFQLFYKAGRPVAAVLHARLSVEVAARLDGAPGRLEPAESSGDTVVLMRTIAPFGGGEQVAAEAMRAWTSTSQAIRDGRAL